MAKFKFGERLYKEAQIIHAEFRSHQATIRQLASRYDVGQETMRQFLIITLDEEYHEIVTELRQSLFILNKTSLEKARRKSLAGDTKHRPLTRSMSDFTPDELARLHSVASQIASTPQVDYYPYIVSPILGDIDNVEIDDDDEFSG